MSFTKGFVRKDSRQKNSNLTVRTCMDADHPARSKRYRAGTPEELLPMRNST